MKGTRGTVWSHPTRPAACAGASSNQPTASRCRRHFRPPVLSSRPTQPTCSTPQPKTDCLPSCSPEPPCALTNHLRERSLLTTTRSNTAAPTQTLRVDGTYSQRASLLYGFRRIACTADTDTVQDRPQGESPAWRTEHKPRQGRRRTKEGGVGIYCDDTIGGPPIRQITLRQQPQSFCGRERDADLRAVEGISLDSDARSCHGGCELQRGRAGKPPARDLATDSQHRAHETVVAVVWLINSLD